MTAIDAGDRRFRDRSFPTLNAVRAAGALMVVCTHVAFDTGQINRGWTGAALSRMDFGVTLFFILSGFLLSRPFLLNTAREAAHPSWRHYFWKRALRILPLYWLFTLFWFWLSGAIGHPAGPRSLMDSLLLAPLPTGPVLVVGWTLEQEFLLRVPDVAGLDQRLDSLPE